MMFPIQAYFFNQIAMREFFTLMFTPIWMW
jgi:hypothetical protein